MSNVALMQTFINGNEYELFVSPKHVEALKQAFHSLGCEANYSLNEPAFMFHLTSLKEDERICSNCGYTFSCSDPNEDLCEGCALARDLGGCE